MDLNGKAKELLEAGDVKVVLGFEPGTAGVRRPAFVRKAGRTGRLVFDAACTQNLASYVTRKEVKRLGKVALVARPTTLRALLQLMAERQIQEQDILPLALDAAGQVVEVGRRVEV